MSKHKKASRKVLENPNDDPQESLDILKILSRERHDSKPNMAKFLNTYVKAIRCYDGGKLYFWPKPEHFLLKVFVTFADGHDLVYDFKPPKPELQVFLTDKSYEDEELTSRDRELVQTFIQELLDFKFIY